MLQAAAGCVVTAAATVDFTHWHQSSNKPVYSGPFGIVADVCCAWFGGALASTWVDLLLHAQ
jgi:hypothetical protein